nr:MAG TPA: hypothetical protein [Caudoviricetes sp.]
MDRTGGGYIVRNDVKLKEKTSLVRKLAPEHELKLLARKNPRY